MIYLLDLNQTLVNSERGAKKLSPFNKQIEIEEYRMALVEFLRDKYTILITARPEKYKLITLTKIEEKTGWIPQEAFFAENKLYPHIIKKLLLEKYILPSHGKDGSKYFGIESNPKTRAMYEKYGISAMPYAEFYNYIIK